uniref:Uncharacterized protein n=1 Tax=Arundo donax TaxID=35708 RepID=A0A0A9DMC9_ARUDO
MREIGGNAALFLSIPDGVWLASASGNLLGVYLSRS